MIDQKKIILRSVEFMNDGVSLSENIKKNKTDNNQINAYVQACIFYNYAEYTKCMKQLIFLYRAFNQIDCNLYIYCFFMLLTTQEEIQEDLLINACKVHAEIKNEYTEEQIKNIDKSIFHYVNKIGYAPECFTGLLSDIISPKLILYMSSLSKDHLKNKHLASRINFDNIKNKNVTNCYYNKSSSGIGDFLRGCCYLFELLDGSGSNFEINFEKHDVSRYISSDSKIKFHEEEIFDTEKNNKELCIDSDYIKNMKDNICTILNSDRKNLLLFSNYSDYIDKKDVSHISLTKKCQLFMQKNLIFSQQVIDEYEKAFKDISSDYSVMHFRLGDRKMLKAAEVDPNNINTKQYNVSIIDMYNLIVEKSKKIGKDIVVLSDCNELKEYVKTNTAKDHRNKIHIIHSKSQHSSDNPGNIEYLNIDRKEKEQNMFYVALDMKIISMSSHIYSYSVYAWGSGFVFWLAKIFNIRILTTQIGV